MSTIFRKKERPDGSVYTHPIEQRGGQQYVPPPMQMQTVPSPNRMRIRAELEKIDMDLRKVYLARDENENNKELGKIDIGTYYDRVDYLDRVERLLKIKKEELECDLSG